MNSRTAENLLARHELSDALIAQARVQSTAQGRRVIELIEEGKQFDRSQLIRSLASMLGFRPLDESALAELVPAFDVIPFPEASARECIALRDRAGALSIACCDPWSSPLRSWAENYVKPAFAWALIHPTDFVALLAKHEESLTAMDVLAPEEQVADEQESDSEKISLRRISEEPSPVVRFVNSTLFDALRSDASDIHFEVSPAGLNVKYRLDGVLVSAGGPRMRDSADEVLSRIKVMAELDISERRIPQDGRFRVSIDDREVDFRVSVMPSIHGEDAVLRILDKRNLVETGKGLSVEALGFDTRSHAALRSLAREPYGMMLVTGPTGSGKTTTLYALISEINDGRDKIVTIEDPVEYQLNGVLQIPVNEKKGLTFARGLRSILRHDPDKILVGEIRDSETAQIAVQAALTGHLVFTTVHANNVFDVIGRFIHMQVEPYSFVSALNGIVAQRLIRMVCPHCARPTKPSEELLRASGLRREDVKNFKFVSGAGCGDCRGTGYKGRKSIAEILDLNEEIRELIVARSPFRELRIAAQKNGTVFLRERAVELVKKGETTLEEINRVTLVA